MEGLLCFVGTKERKIKQPAFEDGTDKVFRNVDIQ